MWKATGKLEVLLISGEENFMSWEVNQSQCNSKSRPREIQDQRKDLIWTIGQSHFLKRSKKLPVRFEVAIWWNISGKWVVLERSISLLPEIRITLLVVSFVLKKAQKLNLIYYRVRCVNFSNRLFGGTTLTVLPVSLSLTLPVIMLSFY